MVEESQAKNLKNVTTAKTQEYKLCKKIAELTQVVHKLFMRAVEAEHKNKAITKFYENEFKCLNQKFETREKDVIDMKQAYINELEEKIENLTTEKNAILNNFLLKEKSSLTDRSSSIRSSKSIKDFSCQFPSHMVENTILENDKKLVELTQKYKRLKGLNDELRSKIIKMEIRTRNEKVQNERYVSKLKEKLKHQRMTLNREPSDMDTKTELSINSNNRTIVKQVC